MPVPGIQRRFLDLDPNRTRGVAAVLVAMLTAAPLARAQAQEPTPGAVTVIETDPLTGAALHPTDQHLAYLNPGLLFSLVGGKAPAFATGVEASVMLYPTGRVPSIGFGPFIQAQLYDAKWFRGALGGQISFGPFGLEAGAGFRQGDDRYSSTFSSHTGQFLSIGYMSLAVRESIALLTFPANAPSFGFETAFTLTLKLPLTLYGHDPTALTLSPWGR